MSVSLTTFEDSKLTEIRIVKLQYFGSFLGRPTCSFCTFFDNLYVLLFKICVYAELFRFKQPIYFKEESFLGEPNKKTTYIGENEVKCMNKVYYLMLFILKFPPNAAGGDICSQKLSH